MSYGCHLTAYVSVDGEKVITINAERREADGQPIRREPEPLMDPASWRSYEGKTMGNDVYSWDFRVSGGGKVTTNLPESPIEHRVADGWSTLLREIMGGF